MGAPDIFDLAVIGSGPAGEKAAAQAAYFGKRVVVIEKEREPGGATTHTGTLPSKTLREAALYLSGHRSRELYGVAVELSSEATLRTLLERTRAIAAAESLRIRENLIRHEVTYVEGHARFEDAHTLAIDGGHPERIRAEVILIATGSRPRRPEGVDFDSPIIHDTDELLSIEALPSSMTIVGAGVVGCEYACMFAALGVEIVLLDRREAILAFLDHEIVDRLSHAMRRHGIRMLRGAEWREIRATAAGVETELGDGERVVTEQLLFAAGRLGNTHDLGLERIGLQPNARGQLEVDDAYRTALPHVLAAGDVIGFPALASTSKEQGRIAVCRAFGFAYKQRLSEHLPYGIYTIPEVSAVGETEHTAVAKRIDYVVGRSLYRNNPRGRITGDLEGITKLLVERSSRKLIGVHVIGERATELVHIGQAAMVAGATVDLFIEMVFNFPTLAESYEYAAYDCLGSMTTAKGS